MHIVGFINCSPLLLCKQNMLHLNCCLSSMSSVAKMLSSDYRCLTGNFCGFVEHSFIKIWSQMHDYSIKSLYKVG